MLSGSSGKRVIKSPAQVWRRVPSLWQTMGRSAGGGDLRSGSSAGSTLCRVLRKTHAEIEAKVSEIRYKPWGEIRSVLVSPPADTSPAYKLSNYTFTGQYSYMDDPITSGVTEGFGLMFYNARFYSPYINHFTSPDTIIPDQTNPQSWDRYSYVSNNPLRYTDPTGHQLCGDGENVNCGGTLNNPTGNAGNCNGSACQGGGSHGNNDEDDFDEPTPQTPSCNKYPCPPVYEPSIECNMFPCPGNGTSYSSYDDFTGFWEMDHFSGGGFRIGFSIWSPLPFIGGDISLDLIQNSNSGETTLYFTPSLLLGIGEGGDASFSAVGLYDAPSAVDVKGASFGAQANLSILGGVQGSYNYSDTTGSSGLHAQTWGIGPSVGAEGSVSGSLGWTFIIVNWKP